MFTDLKINPLNPITSSPSDSLYLSSQKIKYKRFKFCTKTAHLIIPFITKAVNSHYITLFISSICNGKILSLWYIVKYHLVRSIELIMYNQLVKNNRIMMHSKKSGSCFQLSTVLLAKIYNSVQPKILCSKQNVS